MPADPRPRLPGPAADVLVALFVCLITFAPSPGHSYGMPSPWSLGLTAVVVIVLMFRRRRPVPALAGSLIVFAIAAVTGAINPGLGIAVAVASFGVTSRTTRRIGLIATFSAVAAVVVLTLVSTIGADLDPRVVQYALAVLVGSAIGDAARSRREYIRAVMDRALRAEETREAEARRRVSEERLRIARDLHDAVAHQIAVISLHAGVASSAVDARPEKAKESLATIRSAARTVLGEIGALLEVLRSDDDDAPTAPLPGLDRIDELVARFADAGLDVTVRVEGDLAEVGAGAGVVAYRVLQESLTNAHKHGAEHRAHVLLTVDDDALTLVVTNPVDSAAAAVPGSRLGLTGLRERVSAVRGAVETGRAPGGWRVTARLPLEQKETS